MKIFYKISLIAIMILCILIINNGCKGDINYNNSKDKTNKKLIKYRKEMFCYFEKHPEFLSNNEISDELADIINSSNLTGEENLQIQRQILEDIDINSMDSFEYFSSFKSPFEFWLFNISYLYLYEKWKEKLSEEDVIMNCIMPILKTLKNSDVSDLKLKIHWIVPLGLSLRNINNQNLSLNEENRNEVMDFLISDISDKNNPIILRIKATKTWIFGEKRKIKIAQVFKNLLNDEEVFEKTGTYLWFLTKEEPLLYDMMFSVLEKDDKYSDKIILGALEFFFRDSVNFRNDTQGKRRIRLKKVLNNIIKKEKAQVLLDKAKLILSYIEKNEKEGRYK